MGRSLELAGYACAASSNEREIVGPRLLPYNSNGVAADIVDPITSQTWIFGWLESKRTRRFGRALF